MLTLAEALTKAEQHLSRLSNSSNDELAINVAEIGEKTRGWIFPYNTKRFLQTQLPTDGLVGNGPIFVDKTSGEVFQLPSGGWRNLLDEYERTGTMPSFKRTMKQVGDGSPINFPKRPL